MSNENPLFVMSKFASEKDLYKAKAEYFEEKYNLMRDAIVNSTARLDKVIEGAVELNNLVDAQAETIQRMENIINELERREAERGLE